jgi:aspartate racemase
VIGANTMHKSVEFMRKSEECPPIIHIATAVAEACVTDGVKQVGLLGTAWTMENALYIGELATRGVTTVVPLEAQRKRINDIIYSQLCKQIVRQEDASYVQDVVLEFMVKQHGCTAIIMGCTELPLLGLDSSKVGGVKCYNTTEVHAQAAINFLLRK